MSTRILTLIGAPHPQARIESVDAATGACVFAWLDAEGNPVDSGGSIARFTPLAPLPADPEFPDAALIYPEVDDAILTAAIANPPADPLPVPAEVSPRQIRLWLLTVGVTDAQIRAQLAGNPAGLIEWDYATTVRRDHPLVAQLGAALGLSATQLDDAFRAAAIL